MSGRRARRERRKVNLLIESFAAQQEWMDSYPGAAKWWKIPKWLKDRPVKKLGNGRGNRE